MSAREAEVLAALGEHLTNAEIAARLFISVRTVARLLVPFEMVFPVPGLSLTDDRAAEDGAPGDMRRVAAICRGLDGVALVIELTAARFPSLGLDGIEAGLADRMNLLAGGRRADDRHRSLRSALDWSYALLDPADEALLRRISVFAAPFTAAAAEAVCAPRRSTSAPGTARCGSPGTRRCGPRRPCSPGTPKPRPGSAARG